MNFLCYYKILEFCNQECQLILDYDILMLMLWKIRISEIKDGEI